MKIRCDKYSDEPAIWEEGGRDGNEGYALIIAASDGEPKEVVKERYDVSCGRHALFCVEEGDFIIKASYLKDAHPPTVVEVYQIKRVGFDDEEDSYVAQVELIAKWKKDLEGRLPPYLGPAVQAAEEKAMCCACDHVHYGRRP
jgi:hypothetical protein